jgi:predicted Zn-dependent peptidase
MENTCYHARVLNTHTEKMIDILSDIFLNSVFDADEVEKERPVIFQEIGMIEDSPVDYIHHLSEKTFWGDHPLGRSILGSPENIIRFDTNTLKNFFSKFYQPDGIVISAAGNLEHDRLVDLLGPAFETVHAGISLPQRIIPHSRSAISVNHRDLEQAHICLETEGISITDPRRFAFSLMHTIFGGNMSSRLFQEIREKRGMAYSVYSFISSYVDSGLFGAYAAVVPEKTQETVQVILSEISKLVQHGVDSAELTAAKEFSKGNVLLSTESVDTQMLRLAINEIHFNRYFPIEDTVRDIDSVRQEQINDLVKTLFTPDKFSLTILGPVDEDSFKPPF